jgi:hypothetical protein
MFRDLKKVLCRNNRIFGKPSLSVLTDDLKWGRLE